MGLKLYCMIFMDLFSNFWRFNPFLEDLGPFFRPNLWGEVRILLPTSYLYKPEALEAMKGVQSKEMLQNC
jgi:hypothetical protein